MALIFCPECGHEVSTAAVACPQCGRPTNVNPPAPARVLVTEPVEREGVPPWAIAAGVLAGVLVVFGLIWLLTSRDDSESQLALNVNARRNFAPETRDDDGRRPSRTVNVASTEVETVNPASSEPYGTVYSSPSASAPRAPATPEKGTVRISASIAARNGEKRSVRGTRFYLLDEDLETILADADLEPIAGQSLSVSLAMAMADQQNHDDFYRKAMAAVREHTKYAGTTDSSGKAQLGGVEPDSYYLFGLTKSGSGFAMWNSTVSVIAGDNDINLAPQTITEMPRMDDHSGLSEFYN